VSRRRKRKQTNPVVLVAVVAAVLYGFGQRWTQHQNLALLVVSVGLLLFAWLKWKINRLQDRFNQWVRRHRERLEAAPAVVVAVVAGSATAGVVVSHYLAWLVGGLVVVAALVVGGLVASGRGRRLVAQPVDRQAWWSVRTDDRTRPVYFGWQADQNDIDRPFAWKIGISWDPEGTWKGFDRGNALPVHKVGEVPGGRAREQAIHRQLRKHRIPKRSGDHSREWFYDRLEVRMVVDDLCAEAGIDNPFPRDALAA
jgi:T5orf172 domain